MTITRTAPSRRAAAQKKARASDRLHSERRLGLRLSAPGVHRHDPRDGVPAGVRSRAVVYKYRLTDPPARSSSASANTPRC